MRRNDEILIVVILLAVGIMWAWMYGHRERGGYVVVSVDGEEYGKYSLEEEQMVEIGETNRLEITDGGAKMVHADCPDQICVQTPAIKREHEMIVCMPNRVSVMVER